MPGVVGTVTMAVRPNTVAPGARAGVATTGAALFDGNPHTLVLLLLCTIRIPVTVAGAAHVPAFLTEKTNRSVPPGATEVLLTEVICGIRSGSPLPADAVVNVPVAEYCPNVFGV